uniref:C6 domain-containing protein n=1 Tax=Rhabditophanes sp. KR3021 TaxID=114890 RepID=A0AC35TM55_9BILA
MVWWFIFLIQFVDHMLIESCARSSGTANPTVTTAPIITTTLLNEEITTESEIITPAPDPCAPCAPLIHGATLPEMVPTTETPLVTDGVCTNTLSCTANNAGETTTLLFNDGNNGVETDGTVDLSRQLTCSADGDWTYTINDPVTNLPVSAVITQIECISV